MSARNVTIKDVAKAASASITTVSRVLNNSDYPVSAEVRNRILKAAEELNYRPNGLGKALKMGRSHEIGVIVPSLLNPYYAEVVNGIENACYTNGYMPIICGSNDEPTKEIQHLDFFLQMRMDGMVISTLDQSKLLVEKVQKAGIPTVFCDQPVENCKCDSITYDFYQAGKMAAAYLVECGHREIGFFALPFTRKSRTDRYEGFCAGLKEAGLPFRKENLYIAPERSAMEDSMGEFFVGRHLVKEFLSRSKATAIVAMNDLMALGAISGFSQNGVSVPEQVSVIGFDDIAFSMMSNPPLTTVKQPSYDMGREAAVTLIEKIEKKTNSRKTVILQPMLMERSSVCNIR